MITLLLPLFSWGVSTHKEVNNILPTKEIQRRCAQLRDLLEKAEVPYVIGFTSKSEDGGRPEVVEVFGHGMLSDYTRTVHRVVGRAIYDNMDADTKSTWHESRVVGQPRQPTNWSGMGESCRLGG